MTLWTPGIQSHRVLTRNSVQRFIPTSNNERDSTLLEDKPYIEKLFRNAPGFHSKSIRQQSGDGAGASDLVPYPISSGCKLSWGFAAELLDFRDKRATLDINWRLSSDKGFPYRPVPEFRLNWALRQYPPENTSLIEPQGEWNINLNPYVAQQSSSINQNNFNVNVLNAQSMADGTLEYPVVTEYYPTLRTYNHSFGGHINELVYFLPNLKTEKWFYVWITLTNQRSMMEESYYNFLSMSLVAEDFTPATPDFLG